MSYSTNPVDALIQRARYLCKKHGVGLKGNSWNPCWRVWVELVQKIHLIWPPERVVFYLTLGMDERMGVGPSTLVQGAIEICYCDGQGEHTGSETFLFEWFCPFLLTFGDVMRNGEWKTAGGQTSKQQQAWLRRLLMDSTLRQLSVQDLAWKRAIGTLKDDVMEYSDEAIY